MNLQERAAQVCFDAAAYIEKHGLAKGKLEEIGTGSVCAEGVLNVIDHGHSQWPLEPCDRHPSFRWKPEVQKAALALMDRVAPDGNVHWWNNKPERTSEEVCAEFRATGRDLLGSTSTALPLPRPEISKV